MDTAKTLRRRLSLRHFLACLGTLAASLSLLTTAHAAGSAEAGQARSIVCAGCHGVDGNSFNPEWPSLAGQNASYLIKALQSFKEGSRQNVLMNAQAAALSEQDMQDLAAWFASQKLAGKTVLFVDGNALAACFDPNITEDLVKELAKRQPLRAVFRDSSFASDSTKINVAQIFKLLSPNTEVKCL